MRGGDVRTGGRLDEDFRAVVEQAADGIFIASADGVYLQVNASGHRLLGFEPGELIGKKLTDVLAPEELPRAAESTSGLLKGEVHTRDWVMRRKDGTLMEVEITGQLLASSRMLGVVRDARPRKRIENQIRASEARLRSILETAPDIIMTVDRDGRILFLNRTLPPLSVSDVLGTICYDYVPAESRARVAEALDRAFSKGEHDEYEVRGPPGADGERVWSSVRVGPLIVGDRVLAATLCATDVTARRKEEARTQELASRLQKIASQVPGMVYQYKMLPDGGSCFPYASERIREIFRVSPDEVRDDANKVFAVMHTEDLGGLSDSIAEAARLLQPWHGEYRVRFPDGDVHWLHGSAVPEKQSDGAILWHGYINDITQRKEAERAKSLLEAQLRQSQKVESIGKLAGGVAHDFNNLLTSMMGFIELAMMDLPDGARAAEYLTGALDSARRGAALTQQLLAFARKKIVRPEIVDFNDILTRMAGMIRRLVGEHIEVVLSPAPGVGLVKIDVGSLEQVIMNLVVNARDAIRGPGRISLETRNQILDENYYKTHVDTSPGEYVVLSVIDNGGGMTPEVRARAFEPFFTTKPTGEGTGLGLAMCDGIIRQAGGNISVDSEPQKGATFRVYLPRATGAASAAAAKTPVAPSPGPGTSGHETVLLVEDEETILRVARELLSSLGYRVLTAPDGVRALEVVASHRGRIHLLITDVVMPKMGGFELATKLIELQPGMRVLYSSGYTETSIVDQGVLAEGINFLQKPYSPSTLARRVREALSR
jgi:two-component system cell cycle sensor histidine kinase/response regulator CckA